MEIKKEMHLVAVKTKGEFKINPLVLLETRDEAEDWIKEQIKRYGINKKTELVIREIPLVGMREKMGNCFTCIYARINYNKSQKPEGYVLIDENPRSVLGNGYGKCEAGKTEELKAWWKENCELDKTLMDNEVHTVENSKDFSCIANAIGQLGDFKKVLEALIDTSENDLNKLS